LVESSSGMSFGVQRILHLPYDHLRPCPTLSVEQRIFIEIIWRMLNRKI